MSADKAVLVGDLARGRLTASVRHTGTPLRHPGPAGRRPARLAGRPARVRAQPHNSCAGRAEHVA